GHLRQMVRHSQSGQLVTTTWKSDSLGRVHELDELEAAPQIRTYSSWGDLLEVAWTDTTTTPAVEHKVDMRYDGLGLLQHSEERQNGSLDSATVHDYLYDLAASTPLVIDNENVLGRLAEASTPGGSVFMSYDGHGRLAARTYISNDAVDAGEEFIVRR